MRALPRKRFGTPGGPRETNGNGQKARSGGLRKRTDRLQLATISRETLNAPADVTGTWARARSRQRLNEPVLEVDHSNKSIDAHAAAQLLAFAEVGRVSLLNPSSYRRVEEHARGQILVLLFDEALRAGTVGHARFLILSVDSSGLPTRRPR